MKDEKLNDLILDIVKRVDAGENEDDIIELLIKDGMSQKAAKEFMDTIPTKVNMRNNIAVFVWWLLLFIVSLFASIIVISTVDDSHFIRSVLIAAVVFSLTWAIGRKLKVSYRKMIGKKEESSLKKEQSSNDISIIRTIERIALWIFILITIYQGTLIKTEDQISDIAADSAVDAMRDEEVVTEGYLEEEYASREAIQEVLYKLFDHISDVGDDVSNIKSDIDDLRTKDNELEMNLEDKVDR